MALPEAKLIALPAPAARTGPAPKGVYFVYNGHEWESHEVLGIPVGANLQHATQIYQQLIKTSDPSAFEFYEAAFNSILKTRGRNQS